MGYYPRELSKNAIREIHHSGIQRSFKLKKKIFRCSEAGAAGRYGTKKMPAKRKTGTTQDRAKRRRIRCGAPRAAHLSAITHIGCVYADEASIGVEYDFGMTRLKRAAS
jgi:hypothetical protein